MHRSLLLPVLTLTMEQLKLETLLGSKESTVISLYGGGGKTAILSRLASEMAFGGKRALITTTTKSYLPSAVPLFLTDDPQYLTALKNHFRNNDLAFLGKRVLKNGKVEGIGTKIVEYISQHLQVSILVEADGSRGLPVKGYASYEPVLPPCSDFLAAIIGADAIGSLISEDTVHRPHEFSTATETGLGSIITEKTAASAFVYMLDVGKLQAPRAETICVLNKADLLKDPGETALKIAGFLCDAKSKPGQFVLTAASKNNPAQVIFRVTENSIHPEVSCVVLAAGESSRMGQDKLLMPYGSKTILEHTLAQVAASGIEDIVVVVKPESPWKQKINPDKFKIVESHGHFKGMAESLKTGLSAVSGKSQGVIFALADQPHVPPLIYRQLKERYCEKLKLITCPVYQGRKGNPTLFDRRTWPELMDLSGDLGGRELLKRAGKDDIDLIETDSQAVITDIDTPENYRDMIKNKQ